ncbi:IS66 family insertion sequence element accessory protein TnpB [Paenibacillus agaridevorans]|uniref:IS66 family insertion sequence element accessory protein TnpB n=1 Tax=Paenibacillus agaridevorans TaxID=171404 RepID=UPI001BE4C9F9
MGCNYTGTVWTRSFFPILFMFCNRRRDKFKILNWDHAGFWLLQSQDQSGVRFSDPLAALMKGGEWRSITMAGSQGWHSNISTHHTLGRSGKRN